MKRAWFSAIALAMVCQTALGQAGGPYEIRRSTLHSGGKQCFLAGGSYRVVSAIGQPATDVLSGADLVLTAGFLSLPTEAFFAPAAEPAPLVKNRFISFAMPQDDRGEAFAIRVLLASMHHPDSPANAPDFTSFEGSYRYVNSLRDQEGDPVFDCPDSPGSTFKCATLGCDPEYRDWTLAFGGNAVHVTGPAVLPSSQYEIAFLRSSCADEADECCLTSTDLSVSTGLWGDVVPGQLNVIDVSAVVDTLKNVPGALPESAILLHGNHPNPLTDSVTVVDIAYVVDALKGMAYPFAGPTVCDQDGP